MSLGEQGNATTVVGRIGIRSEQVAGSLVSLGLLFGSRAIGWIGIRTDEAVRSVAPRLRAGSNPIGWIGVR